MSTEAFECVALELPWKNNQPQISCIPAGSYEMKSEQHAKFGNVYRINGVPGRAGILIHSGNSASDTRGCILPGSSITRLSNKTIVVDSRKALAQLLAQNLDMIKIHPAMS